MTAPATPAVAAEWGRRLVAEYASAAYAAEFAGWLLRIGASPDLVDACLDVARQELDHARGAGRIAELAGGSVAPVVDADDLRLPSTGDLVTDVVGATVRVYCLAETVAVRLFRALRADADVEPVVELFDVILVDEPTHSAFGWSTLDWLLASPYEERTREVVAGGLDAWITALRATYAADGAPTGGSTLGPRGGAPAVVGPRAPAERAWGLIDPAEYEAVVARSVADDIEPRLRRRALRA